MNNDLREQVAQLIAEEVEPTDMIITLILDGLDISIDECYKEHGDYNLLSMTHIKKVIDNLRGTHDTNNN